MLIMMTSNLSATVQASQRIEERTVQRVDAPGYGCHGWAQSWSLLAEESFGVVDDVVLPVELQNPCWRDDQQHLRVAALVVMDDSRIQCQPRTL
ncbi:hypothetical protein AOC05_06865 [Arthrobacter alpinus]|uniref:Uncharacterized protein n=1 Tax=Arthrobacter alpinus TaxID=656366 RepID=A0A0M4RB18_9MICC|nr:hypothetical protein AOC05_06865 [Arthrobacter alpinus]